MDNEMPRMPGWFSYVCLVLTPPDQVIRNGRIVALRRVVGDGGLEGY